MKIRFSLEIMFNEKLWWRNVENALPPGYFFHKGVKTSQCQNYKEHSKF